MNSIGSVWIVGEEGVIIYVVLKVFSYSCAEKKPLIAGWWSEKKTCYRIAIEMKRKLSYVVLYIRSNISTIFDS